MSFIKRQPAGALVCGSARGRQLVGLQQPAAGATAAFAVLPWRIPGLPRRAGLQHLCRARAAAGADGLLGQRAAWQRRLLVHS